MCDEARTLGFWPELTVTGFVRRSKRGDMGTDGPIGEFDEGPLGNEHGREWALLRLVRDGDASGAFQVSVGRFRDGLEDAANEALRWLRTVAA